MRLKSFVTAQIQQKTYADHLRKSLEFVVGSEEFLKVTPHTRIVKHGKRGKLVHVLWDLPYYAARKQANISIMCLSFHFYILYLLHLN